LAQESAKYRITSDCDAPIVTGNSNTYRWTLDIGEKSAVFYNESNRAFNREMAEIKANGDAMALIDQLPALGQKYPNENDLQVIVGIPSNGKYTYVKQTLPKIAIHSTTATLLLATGSDFKHFMAGGTVSVPTSSAHITFNGENASSIGAGCVTAATGAIVRSGSEPGQVVIEAPAGSYAVTVFDGPDKQTSIFTFTYVCTSVTPGE